MGRVGPTRAQRERLAAWLEGGQNGAYILPEPVEHWDNWTQFARDYLAGKAGWDFHVGIRANNTDGYAKYFVVRARVAGKVQVPGRLRLPGDSEAEHGLAVAVDRGVREVPSEDGVDQQVQSPVLVDVGEFDQLGQRMEFALLALVPSVIRLKAFQSVEMGRPNVFEETVTGDLLQLSDIGKLDLLRLGLRRHSAEADDGELVHEVVERRSEVLNGVPEDQRPLVIDLYESVGAVDDSPLWWLVLATKGNRNGVRVCRVASQTNGSAKDANVGFRPVKLRPRIPQIKASRHA